MPCENAVVLENIRLADRVYRLTVACHHESLPGQFYMLRQPDAPVLLPRPLSVCDARPGQTVFVYQVVGKGTQALTGLAPGMEISLTGRWETGFPSRSFRGRSFLLAGASVSRRCS